MDTLLSDISKNNRGVVAAPGADLAPCNIDAEAAILSILEQRGTTALDECRPIPISDHFGAPITKAIFTAIRQCLADRVGVSRSAILAKLRSEDAIKTFPAWEIEKILNTQTEGTSAQYYMDMLEAERKRREVIKLGVDMVNAATATGEPEKVKAIVEVVERTAFRISESKTSESVTENAVDELIAMIDVRRVAKKSGEEFKGGMKTGIYPWDKVCGGIIDTRLYTIVGRPGRGKTAAVEQACYNLLLAGNCVVVFEKDMPRERFIGRMACRAAEVSWYKFERGWATDYEMDQIEYYAKGLGDSALMLYDTAGMTANDIRSTVRREKRSNDAKAFFLDYIQLLRCPGYEKDLRMGLTQASLTLKETVNETGVSGVIVAQLNRNGDGRKGRPTAADIKEFDQLHADSGVIHVLDSKDDPGEIPVDQPLRIKWCIDKNNFGPSTDETILFDRRLMRFYEDESEEG